MYDESEDWIYVMTDSTVYSLGLYYNLPSVYCLPDETIDTSQQYFYQLLAISQSFIIHVLKTTPIIPTQSGFQWWLPSLPVQTYRLLSGSYLASCCSHSSSVLHFPGSLAFIFICYYFKYRDERRQTLEDIYKNDYEMVKLWFRN